MITTIDEPIQAGVIFEKDSRIIPRWFVWNGRRHTISRVTFSWRVREGKNLICHFAVTDETHLYELCYHATQFSWRLMAVSNLQAPVVDLP